MRERKWPRYAVLLTLMTVLAACGGGADREPQATASKKEGPTITIGGFGFTESTILVHIYAQALEADGYQVQTRTEIGNREVVAPALEKGDIDFVPEYLNTLLEFLGGEGTADVEEAKTRIAPLLQQKDLQLLTPSQAQNRNELVVTKATAEANQLSKISDLKAVDQDMAFGGPPECPKRPLCLPGLEKTYDLDFDEFKPLDDGGALTVSALEQGEIDVALLFTTDGAIAEKGFIVLEDDLGLQGADNITPVVRTEITSAYPGLAALVDGITAKLTSAALQEMNKKAVTDKEDPEAIATQWLKDNNFLS